MKNIYNQKNKNLYPATIIKTSQDGIFVVDKDGNFEFGNDASFKILGWQSSELIGQPFIKVMPPDVHEFILQRWDEVQRGEGKPYEVDIIKKDGTRVSLLVSHKDMEISGEKKYCVVIKNVTEFKQAGKELKKHREQLEELVIERTAQLQQEITEHKKTGEELLESEIKFRTLVEHLPTIIYIAALDEFSTTLYVSPQVEKILGISPEEYKANPDFWLKHLHNEDRERVLEELKYSYETNQPFISEYRMISKNGKIVWLRDEAMVVNDEKGNPLYLQGIMLDITGHKQAEERIKHLNGVLKAIRNINQLIVVEKDKDRMIQKACDALIDARDYNAAWLGLLQDDKSFTTVVGSGFGEYISRFCENTLTGNYSPCIKNALIHDNHFLIIDKTTECGDCFVKNSCPANEAAIIRIEYDGRLLGLLAISLIAGVHVDEEEKELLKEVTGDIAFALHNMEEEKARKQAEQALQESEERLRIKLDYILSPDKKVKNISLTDLVDLKNLQQIQDAFAVANDVASIISDVDGKPITKASNFCGVCEIIRSTKKGNRNCIKSDKILGEKAKALMKPTYEKCLSCGFVDASAPIIVGGKHIANWLIGQSNVMGVGKKRIETYAKEIGADTKKMLDAFETMQHMTLKKFEQALDLLWYFAKELSTLGYNNLKLAKDITERKQAEKALKESEERFRQVAESAEEWIWEMDDTALYTYASPVVEKLLGYKPKEIVGKKHSYDLFHPDDIEPLKKATLEIFKEKKPLFMFLNRNVHKNGRIVWLSTSGVPIIDDKGNLLGYRGADIDITKQKKAEEELKKYREHLEELVNERTKKLEEKNRELEHMNSLFVGREFRIKELRDKINELEKKNG